jgi:methionyl-tRNA formyltransferase
MRLVFCGTPAFAVPTLRAVLVAGHSVELVLTQPDRASGRGLEPQYSAVKQAALECGLPILQPEKIRTNDALRERLQSIAPDAILVVAYGRIIPPWMLALPRHGNLNLHASLLPKYRGAAPIQWAIARGEQETGVTTMRIDEGLDTGPMLLQRRIPIAPDQTAAEISPFLAETGAALIVETLAGLEQGRLVPAPQQEELATHAPILRREDGHVDTTRSAAEIYNRWRGFQPWPGAYGLLREKKFTLRTLRRFHSAATVQLPAGTLHIEEQKLLLRCGDGEDVELLEVQLEGKRSMAAQEFLRGHPLMPGERLG